MHNYEEESSHMETEDTFVNNGVPGTPHESTGFIPIDVIGWPDSSKQANEP